MTKIHEKKKINNPHYVQKILNKSMSLLIWKDLPFEVLENVLAYLPAHVLCRFRLVCKEWNHLISQPSFATLRTLSPRKASSIFISPKFNYETISSYWQVLDLTEKHSYKLPDSLIMDYYLFRCRNRGLKTEWHFAWRTDTLATDGELIYIVYSTISDLPTRWRMHIVCNPVSKSLHEIPELPEIWEYSNHNNDIVVMSVDNVAKTYKIVSIEMCWNRTRLRSQNIFLYESTTSAWRKLCEVPEAGLSICSVIFMKGIFYTLFIDLSGISNWPMFYTIVLYSCDLVTSAWCKIDVNFSRLSVTEKYPQLVVSSGRLYMVKFTRYRTRMVTLSIWKVVLETKEVVKKMKIKNQCCKLSDKMIQLSKFGEMSVAVGCADSIIILDNEGFHMKFDLLEKRW